MRSVLVGLPLAVALVSGCGDSVGPGPLSYEAVTNIVSTKAMAIRTVVIARNVSTRTVRIDRNICPVRYTAHSAANREGAPAWAFPESSVIECAAWAGPLDLVPGDYYQFEMSITLPPAADDGFWFLTLHFALRDPVALPVGQIAVNQGVVYKP